MSEHRRRHHRHHHARDTIQSAVQLQHPFSFDNYNPLRRSGNSSSHHHLRRQSPPRKSESTSESQKHHQHQANQQQHPEPPKIQVSPEVENADLPRRRLITPETIAHERKQRQRRQDQVSEALNSLSRDAHTATRRLDDTYYSLLEKAATLKATISSIQDLQTSVDEATKDFKKNSEVLSKDAISHIDSFANFTQQDESIDTLVTRLQNAKSRSQTYEKRLESCRSRLENWERRDREERQRNNRWWAIALSSLAVFLILLISLIMWKKGTVSPPTQLDWRHTLGLKPNNRSTPGIRLTDPKIEKEHAKEEARWGKLLDEL